jgi:hypothetical protein
MTDGVGSGEILAVGDRFPNHASRASLGLALLGALTPAWAGPPYLTDDPETPPLHRWEAVLFTSGTLADGTTTAALPAIEFNYGGFEATQLHIMVPVGFHAGGHEEAEFGASDIELGVKYRFIEEDEQGWRPQVAVYPQFEIPTGSSRNGLSSAGVDVFLPAWTQKNLDENWTVDAGGGYWINPGSGNRNYWFSGILLQRKLGDTLVAGVEIFHQTSDTEGGRAGSGFNLGAIYDFNEHNHLLLSAGRGLQNATATDQFTWYVGYKITN